MYPNWWIGGWWS